MVPRSSSFRYDRLARHTDVVSHNTYVHSHTFLFSFCCRQCKVKQGGGHGILCQGNSAAKLIRCHLLATGSPEPAAAVVARSESTVRLVKCHVDVADGATKILEKEGSIGGGAAASSCSITCSNNTATASFLRGTSAIPGFRSAEDGS
jgi:hypothetical protein